MRTTISSRCQCPVGCGRRRRRRRAIAGPNFRTQRRIAALGRCPPASRCSPKMSRHSYFGTDPRITQPGIRRAALGRDAGSAGRPPARRMSARQRRGCGVASPQALGCSSQPGGSFPSISASRSTFGWRPSRIASTRSGATQIGHRNARHEYEHEILGIGIERRADRHQPAPYVLRYPGASPGHDQGRQGLDHQLRLKLVVGGVRRQRPFRHRWRRLTIDPRPCARRDSARPGAPRASPRVARRLSIAPSVGRDSQTPWSASQK